ncbi:hypothetical protein NDU88_010382 [Pleurodeles waltl]|uniref:Uncharacterized protein n=1 Tax=Pleurodeles waltl TaxID=8319 RepID=A0AAV7PXR5_PLEWA|nr:hypothetical protein NDU88_010382 [Pleurodeles waltl]
MKARAEEGALIGTSTVLRSGNSVLKLALIKSELKTGIHKLNRKVNKLGERVDDLEHAVDTPSEDQETLWCKVMAVAEQQIELQMKQEDCENRSWKNYIRIRGIARGAKGMDTIAFIADLLHAIHEDKDAFPSALDIAH